MKQVRVCIAWVLVFLCLAAPACAAVVEESEPNNSPAQANDIAPGSQVRGTIGKNGDKDCFAFSLESARQIELALKQWAYQTNIVVMNVSTNKTHYSKQQNKALGKSSATLKKKLKLPAGKYCFILSSKDGKKRGRYQLSYRDVKAVSVGIKLPKTFKIVKGKSAKLKLQAVPDGFSMPKVRWRSSKSGVVSVSKDGTIKAKAVGMSFVEATASNGKRALCKVTVVKK